MRKRIALIAAAALSGIPVLAPGAVMNAAGSPVGGAAPPTRAYEDRYLDVRQRFVEEFGAEAAGRNIVRSGYVEEDGDVRSAERAEVVRSTERMQSALAPEQQATAEAQYAAPAATTASSVVQCESGGDYGAVDATGTYYGAYQFDQQTWDAYAPDGYAGTSPAAAPPEVQDTTAASVPYDAWPNC